MLRTLAQYLADNTSLILGDSLWLHNIPENDTEGCIVKRIKLLQNFGTLQNTRFAIFFFHKSWTSQENLLATAADLFMNLYGLTDASWGISDEVETQDFGIDEFDRYISAIFVNIQHK